MVVWSVVGGFDCLAAPSAPFFFIWSWWMVGWLLLLLQCLVSCSLHISLLVLQSWRCCTRRDATRHGRAARKGIIQWKCVATTTTAAAAAPMPDADVDAGRAIAGPHRSSHCRCCFCLFELCPILFLVLDAPKAGCSSSSSASHCSSATSPHLNPFGVLER